MPTLPQSSKNFLAKCSATSARHVRCLVLIGDKLGLYKALAEHGPLSLGGTRQVTRARRNATCANGWRLKQHPGYVNFDARHKSTQ